MVRIRFTEEKQRSAEQLDTGMVMATLMHSKTKLNATRKVTTDRTRHTKGAERD